MRAVLAAVVALACAGTAWAQAPTKPVPGTRYVYLVRHAIYDRDTTVTDDRKGNGLNALGHEQAELTGKRLAALPVKFGRFVSSDYLRAVQTAADIGAELGRFAEQDSLLQECTPNSDVASYMRNHTPGEIALCESHLDAAWAKYFVPATSGDANDLLVCHGNVIRWLVARALGNDTSHWTRMEIANGSVTIIAVRPDGSTRVVLFSDASHVPIAKQTWTGRGAGWGGR